MTRTFINKQTILVDHVRVRSTLPFSAVKANLERLVPPLPTDLLPMMQRGEKDAVRNVEENGSKLYIFTQRDHGATLTVAIGARKAIQYVIGNPITAVKMTRHDIRASLYAPLRVTLFESEDGEAIFEYDLPSTQFGQFGNDQVTDVGLYLDRELEAVLLEAAGSN